MKVILAFTTLLTFNNLLFSQTNIYHPFKTSGATWSYMEVTYCCPPPFGNFEDSSIIIKKITSDGETVIDGKKYFIVSVFMTMNYILEDTIEGKIYLRHSDFPFNDTLLFDYSLEVGNSVNHLISFADQPSGAFVQEIDSVLIDGNYRKRWNIHSPTGIYYNDPTPFGEDTVWVDVYWIEGIGGSYHLLPEPFFPGFAPLWRRELICYGEEGINLIESYPDYVNCDSVLIDIDFIIDFNSRLDYTVNPNPLTNESLVSIKSNSENKRYKLQIYNTFGQLIISDFIYNDYMIQKENFTPGIYLIFISDDKNNFNPIKLIVI